MDLYFTKAQQLYSQGNYEEAYCNYLKSADMGNTKAMNELAMLFAQGKGFPQSNAGAFSWFLSSAELGDSVGQFNIGMAYENALGVQQNIDKAIEWYTKSADNGNVKAQINLAYLYIGNCGVATNLSLALKYISLYGEKTPNTAFTHLSTLRENVHQQLRGNYLGKLYARKSDAHRAVRDYLKTCKGFAESFVTYSDIFLYLDFDSSVENNNCAFEECFKRLYDTRLEYRKIPCFEIHENHKLIGRFGFLLDDRTL